MNISYKAQQGNGNVSAYTNRDIARAPDFKGNGCDVWVGVDKNGNKFLNVKILNGLTVKCWKYEPKEEAFNTPDPNDVLM